MQYEDYPYPMRNPDDERKTIYVTATEFLGKISHYCFRGKRDLRCGCRFLVAGGGTGDAAIYLAEQLRSTDSHVVYLDISRASMDIARKRAAIRGLDNITWYNNSLLELPGLVDCKFDYINCCGVLHHLENPRAGLLALKSVLKNDGAMGLMLYGKIGRTAIYQMQDLMRLVNSTTRDPEQKIDNTRHVLASLPDTSWYRRDEANWITELSRARDTEIYDLFLHAQDQAYTIQDIYRLLGECGLNLVYLTGFPGQSLKYRPGEFIHDKHLLSIVGGLPVHEQQAVAELLCGNIKTHTFYTSANTDTVADLTDRENVPYYTFRFASGEQLYSALSTGRASPIRIQYSPSASPVLITPGKWTGYLLRYIDGKRSIREIFDCVREAEPGAGSAPPPETELMASVREIYTNLNSAELMLLRHRSIGGYRTGDDLLIKY